MTVPADAGKAQVAADAALPLLTARIRLRRPVPDDLPRWRACHDDPEALRWQDQPQSDEASARAVLIRSASHPIGEPGFWLHLVIADRDDDRLIGDIGVQWHGRPAQVAELGFTLVAAARGRGLATEAVGAVLQMLLVHTAVQRVVCVADTRNAASLRLLARVGLRPYAMLPVQRQGAQVHWQRWVLHRGGRVVPQLAVASAADADAVAAVIASSRRVLMPFVPTPYTAEQMRDWAAHTLLPAGGVTVARAGGQVVGVLALREAPQALWIDQLYVHPTCAGAGVGAALLGHACERAAAARKPLRLYCFQANGHACAFYEAHGFHARSRSDGAHNPERCPDVLYERPCP